MRGANLDNGSPGDVARLQSIGERVRLASIALLLWAVCAAASAQSVSIDRILVTSVGIYRAVEIGTRPAPSLASGAHTHVEDAALVKRGQIVPAQKGVRFGYTYRVIGQPLRAQVPLRFVTLYPAPGLVNPNTGKRTRQDEVWDLKAVGEPYVDGYTFDHDWEIVPGAWTFQIWHQDRKLAEQKFTVVEP